VTKYLCFGGGVTSVQAEFIRDAYCVNKDVLPLTDPPNSSGMRLDGVSPSDDPRNMIEARVTVNNEDNELHVDHVLVQLLQIIALKREVNGKKEVFNHVKEVVYRKEMNGLYRGDRMASPEDVKINLEHLQRGL